MYLAGDVDGAKVVGGRHHHGVSHGKGMSHLKVGREALGQIRLPSLKELLCQAHIYKDMKSYNSIMHTASVLMETLEWTGIGEFTALLPFPQPAAHPLL